MLFQATMCWAALLHTRTQRGEVTASRHLWVTSVGSSRTRASTTFLTFRQSFACSDAKLHLFLKLSGDASPGSILTRMGGVELSDRLLCTMPGNTEEKPHAREKRQISQAEEFQIIYVATLPLRQWIMTPSLKFGLSVVTCFRR